MIIIPVVLYCICIACTLLLDVTFPRILHCRLYAFAPIVMHNTHTLAQIIDRQARSRQLIS